MNIRSPNGLHLLKNCPRHCDSSCVKLGCPTDMQNIYGFFRIQISFHVFPDWELVCDTLLIICLDIDAYISYNCMACVVFFFNGKFPLKSSQADMFLPVTKCFNNYCRVSVYPISNVITRPNISLSPGAFLTDMD